MSKLEKDQEDFHDLVKESKLAKMNFGTLINIGKKSSDMPATKSSENRVHYPTFGIDASKAPELADMDIGEKSFILCKILKRAHRMPDFYDENGEERLEIEIHAIAEPKEK